MLDTALTLETPEGTEIDLHPAGLFARGTAFVIDEIIRWCVIAAALLAAGLLGAFGRGLGLIVVFATYWLYGVLFEVLNNGVTPGKRVQGLQCLHDDGTPIRLPASMLRNLVLWVDLLPVAYLAGILSMLFSDRFRRLGDHAAGTMVVYRNAPQSHNYPSDAATRSDLGVKLPAFALTVAEQGSFVDFLERADHLSDARVTELANIVARPLGCDAVDAVAEVKRVAAGVRGEE
jgi:uncharacterized RDD family membrane protein YckC